jgi:hypothetical protein
MIRIRPSAALALILLVAVTATGLAYFLVSRLVLPDLRSGSLPSAGDALLRVPLWVGDEGNVRVILRPLHLTAEANDRQDEILAGALFPDRPGTRFLVLWVFHYGREGDLVVDRRDAISLRAGSGEALVLPDLPAAVAAAGARPDLALQLRTLHAGEETIQVPARCYRRILVALPAGCAREDLGAVNVLGVELGVREVVRYRLEDYLADPGLRDSLLEGAL